MACAVRRHVPTESTLLAGKRPRTFQLERSPISRFSSTRSHSRASNRLYQSNTVLKRHYCTDEKKEEAQETPESEKKTETQETIIDHSKLTREDYVQNPALLEDVELLSDEDLKLVRHHVNKEGKLSLPPMRMVIKHLQRRKTVVIAGCYGFLGNALKASLLSRGHEVRNKFLSFILRLFLPSTAVTDKTLRRLLVYQGTTMLYGLTIQEILGNGGR